MTCAPEFKLAQFKCVDLDFFFFLRIKFEAGEEETPGLNCGFESWIFRRITFKLSNTPTSDGASNAWLALKRVNCSTLFQWSRLRLHRNPLNFVHFIFIKRIYQNYSANRKTCKDCSIDCYNEAFSSELEKLSKVIICIQYHDRTSFTCNHFAFIVHSMSFDVYQTQFHSLRLDELPKEEVKQVRKKEKKQTKLNKRKICCRCACSLTFRQEKKVRARPFYGHCIWSQQ